ncbi:MAG: hypothetical protein C75L2_00300063 [Leptospirillum sp. Group II 'C75']|uniref:hypothetical protein n=1 Tax=Leptospirillum sp. Group II 'CF-1' TaxID=1660083 RepID=UPI00029CBA4F|nr:hypothetical protein [Leptospirillum sp. Group II 'CF-1']EIJ75704.1 MAG: hypothetical protein C75L2_00300063 [Leptospirillum sp. Group II 'C75']
MSDRRIWGIGLFLVCLVTVLPRGTPAAGEEPGFRSSLIVAQGDQSPESAGEATTPPEKKKRQKQKKTSSGPSSATPFPVGKAPPRKKKKPPQVETLVTNTGILVPQGKLLVENTLEYIHNTATQVALQGFTVLPAILIGTINVESVEQDIYMDVLTFYYGITNNLEAEVDVPYVYRTEGSRGQRRKRNRRMSRTSTGQKASCPIRSTGARGRSCRRERAGTVSEISNSDSMSNSIIPDSEERIFWRT